MKAYHEHMHGMARVIDAVEALVSGPTSRVFRLGVALPLQGVIGQAGPSALEAVILAAKELDSRRTMTERPVELVIVDAGLSPARVAANVAQLARSGCVEAFIGLHTSDVLEAIERELHSWPIPYVFTAGHENRPRPLGFFSSGESPAEMAVGVRRVAQERAIQDWAIIGSDYIWPNAVGSAARAAITESAGRVVMDRLVPLGSAAAAAPALLDSIARSGAQGAVVSMPGRELIAFLAALRSTRLHESLIVCSGTLEENVLYALGGSCTGNLYATQHSFETLQSPRRMELNARYAAAFGAGAPALNSWAEHCYDAIHMVVGMERAGLLTVENMAIEETLREFGPSYDIQLGVAAGLSFEVV